MIAVRILFDISFIMRMVFPNLHGFSEGERNAIVKHVTALSVLLCLRYSQHLQVELLVS